MHSGSSPRLRRAATAYVAWVLRHGRWLSAIAVLLAIPAAARTVHLYRHLRSEVEQLLPEKAASVQALDELRSRFPGLQYLAVVVATDENGIPAAEHFLDDLGERMRGYPPELVRSVRLGTEEEAAFLEHHASSYVEAADLRELRRRVEAARDYAIAKESGSLLEEGAPAPTVETADLRAKYEGRFGRRAEATGGGRYRFSNAKLGTSILVAETGDFSTGIERGRALLDRVKADVRALDPSRYGSALRVGYASDVAISVEEFEALEEDLSLSSVLVLAAVVVVVMLYYRWWPSILILVAPLVVATTYAFALASLPPFCVTELNSNTAFMGSIIVGNGINVGIVLLARYREARARGAGLRDGLAQGVAGAFTGTLTASAAAGIAYGSLVATEFRGFRQFGFIGGIGMVTSWLCAFVLMPPLVAWLDRAPAAVSPVRGAFGGLTAFLLRIVTGAPRTVLLVAAALTAVAAAGVLRLSAADLEYDFSKLRRVDTWEHGEGYWGRKVEVLLGQYLTPTVLMTDTEDEARRLTAAVRVAAGEGGPIAPFVATLRTEDDVLPPDRVGRAEEGRALRETMTPALLASLSEEDRNALGPMLATGSDAPLTPSDLPSTFTTGLRENDGRIGRSVLVYPRATGALWRADGIHRFVDVLRGVADDAAGPAERPARLAGTIPISADILSSIERDAPIAMAVAFVGVIVAVCFALRFSRDAFYVLLALIIGVLWLGGFMILARVHINFANFIAFPITLGIGVDYAVNVIARYVQDGRRDVRGAITSTGGAVALCSATTIIGYASLLLAKNRALYLFGLLAVAGEVTCLLAAVVALPALLLVVDRSRRAPRLYVACRRPADPPSV